LQLVEAQGWKEAFLQNRLDDVVGESRNAHQGMLRSRPAEIVP